jgi:pilus assembly protein TadC
MKKFLLLGIFIGAPLLIFNFLFLMNVSSTFYIVNFIAILIAALPALFALYSKHRKVKKLEENFINFLRDFTEAVRGGMTIPVALKHVSGNDYGPLTKYIKKMSAQIDWGIPLHKIFVKFSEECESKLIGRIVSAIVESHAYGGSLTGIMESLSSTVMEIEKLRMERRLFIQSQITTGYIIFFVFIGVIIGLEKFLIPSLVGASSESLTIPGTSKMSPELMETQYKIIFRNLIIIQGIFAGLMVGKMAEGEIVAGIKHAVFLVLVGLLVFLFIG